MSKHYYNRTKGNTEDIRDKTKVEAYAESWFTEHGFDWLMEAQTPWKTIYSFSKDGVADHVGIMLSESDIAKRMDLTEKAYQQKVELEGLRKQLSESLGEVP